MNAKFAYVCKIAKHVFVKYVSCYCNVPFLLCCKKHGCHCVAESARISLPRIAIMQPHAYDHLQWTPTFHGSLFRGSTKTALLRSKLQSAQWHRITFSLNVRGESGLFHMHETRSADIAAVCRVCRKSELSLE